MRMIRLSIIFLTLLAGWLIAAGHAAADASASVDRDRVVSGETIDLRIRVDSVLGVDDPELGVLNRDFEVLGTSRNSRVSIVNGSQAGYTEWMVTLLPKREGVMQIPPINVDGETTAPVPVTVRPDTSPSASAQGDIMLEVDVDTEQPFVQQQVLVTVRLLHAVNLNRGAALAELELDGAVVRKLSENSYRKSVGNRTYGVFERVYAVFPQSSGTLELPPLSFQANVGGSNGFFDQFRNRGKVVRLRSDARTLKVRPPQDAAQPWLPASNLSLVETWDRNPDDIEVGDSLTRTITISADGLTAAQIAPLPVPDIDGLRFYPDQAQLSDQDTGNGVIGTRIESGAVIAQRAGNIEFPAIKVRWWNTLDNRFETAVVPAKTLRVRPPSNSANAGPAAPDPAVISAMNAPTAQPIMQTNNTAGPADNSTPWILSTVFFALLSLFAGWNWYRYYARFRDQAAAPGSKPDSHSGSEKAAWNALRKACNANDPNATRIALKQWASTICPDRAIHSLSAIPAALQAPALDQPIRTLVGAGYTGSQATWNGSELQAALDAYQQQRKANMEKQQNSALKPLYQA